MLKSWNLSQARSYATAWLRAARQVHKELWGLVGGTAWAAVPPGCSAEGRDGHEGEGKRSPHRNTSSSNWSPHADDQPDPWPTDSLDLMGGITASGCCSAGDTKNLGEKGGGKGEKAKQPTCCRWQHNYTGTESDNTGTAGSINRFMHLLSPQACGLFHWEQPWLLMKSDGQRRLRGFENM